MVNDDFFILIHAFVVNETKIEPNLKIGFNKASLTLQKQN
jgi:hypothetical protein